MTDSTSPRQVVVIGAGPAAHRLASTIHRRDTEGSIRLTVIGEEEHLPYDRVALSTRFIGGAGLALDPTIWDGDAIALLRGERVIALDRTARTVTTDTGRSLGYDDVVFATGSRAPVPDIAGAEHARVYRTISDVDDLAAEVRLLAVALGRPPRTVVAGGGLLGLEAAGGLAELGAESSIVHSGKWLMSAQLDEGAGTSLGRLIGARGITMHLGVRPQAIRATRGAVTGVELTDGRVLDADLIVFAIGIAARDEVAAAAGIAVAPRGGIVVDEACRSSDPRVWAVGEVAHVHGRCVGLVAPANAMAEVVADRLLGGDAAFTTIDDATKLKLAGVEVASFGDAFARADSALEVVYADPARGLYQKVVVSDDARTLLGGVFVGDASPYLSLRPLLGRELGSEPAAYLSASGAQPSGADELPDDALLCACNNVCVGAVRAAITGSEECHTVPALKACTRAGTQCGSCVPLLKKTLEQELAKAGLSVSRALCEHFAQSRQELFESIRVLGITSWDEVLSRFGTGRGCDICKPAVASILASQHGSYILDDGRGALQDTNDRALANMQRDGSYSVVPRIPGGEITPEKLAVIARVASDFGLYTKITGGQRIDLFGARLDQLPAIWEQLVEAGFESGHAYGKSLRTVKSCVGSTWCRFGVQDSVGMAILLELRYRGLRAPHKIKLGVSGCARECAEARGKDVGIIATDAGWNLYVGGNGGFQPSHAQLLAGDLDDDTLIRYIDRYLMYYIRTADRLQRTARWMEELEGGLDHVREVVVEDSLGLATELEAAMAAHVDTYEDEWAATLRDPERLKRFRSFINAPADAATVAPRVAERGQQRPATASELADGRVLLAGAQLPVRRSGDE